jgi:hypothetical protein
LVSEKIFPLAEVLCLVRHELGTIAGIDQVQLNTFQ